MRTLTVRHLFIACMAVYAMPLPSSAQQADSDAPPQLEKLEEGEAPAVTIRKPETKNKITEKRAPGGKVTEIKVTSGKSTYYLRPNDPAGSAVPGDAQGSYNRGAQWKVKEFDLGSRAAKEKKEDAAQETPEPPAAPAKAGKK